MFLTYLIGAIAVFVVVAAVTIEVLFIVDMKSRL